jgi:hypothetical protein
MFKWKDAFTTRFRYYSICLESVGKPQKNLINGVGLFPNIRNWDAQNMTALCDSLCCVDAIL